MYDVGCKLRTALKKTPELKDIEDVPIAVGIFHITGHNAACQIQFHPRLVKGFGMIDGEWLERMWSYLNGFVSITRTMSSLNRRLTLTIALDFFAKEKIDNIGITIQRKEQRAKQLLDDARKALQEAGYLDKLEILLAKWEEHIALATQEPTTETGRIKKKVDNAYEILRTAVSIYDIIDQAFKIQGNGHNRTQNLSDQKKSALAKVQKCLDAYNIVARNHSVIGLSPFDNSVSSLLAKNSKFRKHANLLSTMGDDLPYDALHGYLRAQEELKMLREEAMSVLKYGKELVHKLTEATKGPELFDNLSDEVLGMAVICKQKLVEAERWNVDQKRRLTRIAAGLHSVASSGNVRGEDGEEVEEEAEDEECADLAQFENWIESIN
ncbi:hypothetical protein BDB00DRAFT_794226 [Zychaea mexicana]|uniref:uncharacterized protein n=1 Tax=Zychaea mexicana TaxID=64656 RepID=UPI0022FEB45E|nr:uncharacterized protein BDB00DRAFT_794226 [Zychaea mexicana]KAI9499500.1 hypothetical protein BDB00DRAFT_794226 [Zychaea mexicana]